MSGSGVRKRKLNEDKSAPDEIDASDASVHAKRRRQRATIETGFAALSLNRSSPISPNGNPLLSPPGTEYAPQNLNTASTSTSYASNVTQARSQPVGSAPPPPSEEINVDNSSVPDTPMKSSSWYEPEPDSKYLTSVTSRPRPPFAPPTFIAPLLTKITYLGLTTSPIFSFVPLL